MTMSYWHRLGISWVLTALLGGVPLGGFAQDEPRANPQGAAPGATDTPAPSPQTPTDSPRETSAEAMGREVAEAARAIEKYSYEQRDKAIQAVNEALVAMDEYIDHWRQQLDEDYDEMSRAARQQARETLEELEEQRRQVSEWYGGLKHSSAKAWEHVKEGFVESYQTMRDALIAAYEEF